MTWYRIQGGNFHLLIADNEVIDAIDMRRRSKRGARAIRLRMTTDIEQGFEGETFLIGARGIATIACALFATMDKPTGKSLYMRLCKLFPGDGLLREMLSGTICAVLDARHKWPDIAYFKDAAIAQLAVDPLHRVA